MKITKQAKASEILALSREQIRALSPRELGLGLKIVTARRVAEAGILQFDEEIYKKAKAKAGRWNANAYGAAGAWGHRILESGWDCIFYYYCETARDTSGGRDTDNRNTYNQFRRDHRRA